MEESVPEITLEAVPSSLSSEANIHVRGEFIVLTGRKLPPSAQVSDACQPFPRCLRLVRRRRSGLLFDKLLFGFLAFFGCTAASPFERALPVRIFKARRFVCTPELPANLFGQRYVRVVSSGVVNDHTAGRGEALAAAGRADVSQPKRLRSDRLQRTE